MSAAPSGGGERTPSPPRQQQRRVALAGTRNFRDMGGYATDNGAAQTCWHRLYRADHLSRVATDSAACDVLRDELHVSCAIDLRSVSERNQQPYAIAGVVLHRIPMLAGGDLSKKLHTVPELTEDIVEGLMCDVYERFVLESNDELSRFFQLLVAHGRRHPAEEALVFHCKAGKDRTGVCAALLLLALGVPRETVFEDFLLTNQYYEVPPLATIKSVLTGNVEAGAVSALFQARRSYLERALQTIQRDHQDVRTYLRDALGVSDSDIQILQQAYLEST